MTSEYPPPTQPAIVSPKAPVKAMWICLILSLVLFIMPIPGTIFLALPVSLAALILAILCIARGRVGQGIIGLIGTTVGAGIAYLIGLGLMAGGILALSDAGLQAQQNRHQATAANSAETIGISAAQLLRDYEAGEIAANNKYKNRILDIGGRIADIGKDATGIPYIALGAENRNASRVIRCLFAAEDARKLERLSKGDDISIRGKCDGMTGNAIVVRDSKILTKQ